MLESLAHLEATTEQDPEQKQEQEEEDESQIPQTVPFMWAAILMGILALSCVGNLFLLLRGGRSD